jgi:hypothetical protein
VGRMGSGTVGSTSSKSSSKIRPTQAGGASEASRVRGGSRIHWGAHTHWQVCQQPSQSFSGKVQGPGSHDGRSRHGPEKNILKLPRRTYLCRSRLHKGGRKYACKGLPLDPDRHRGSTWGNNRHFFKSDSEKSTKWYNPVLAFRIKCLAATKFTSSASGSKTRSSGTSWSGSDDVELGVGTQSGG